MYGRSRGRGGKRESSHGRGGDRKRRMFTKLMKDEGATMNSVSDAKRFIEGMETYEVKSELLSVLEDNRNLGERRIRDLLSLIGTNFDVETILVPFLLQ
eukprot:15366356-Ditylum_brightwellii.AAC.1